MPPSCINEEAHKLKVKYRPFLYYPVYCIIWLNADVLSYKHNILHLYSFYLIYTILPKDFYKKKQNRTVTFLDKL